MTDDPIKAAEKLGYSRGYRAGKVVRRRYVTAVHKAAREDAFWQRAFIACLATCVDSNGWKTGEKPITDIPGRTSLARDFADEALKVARKAFRI